MAKSTLFYLDGESFEVKLVGITRSVSNVLQYDTQSPVDGVRHRHVMGKYIEYTLTFPEVIPEGMESEYSRLYDKLTELKDWFTVKLPFNNALLTFEASVEDGVTDNLIRRRNGNYQWGGLTFILKSRKPYITE